jgi:hypothetical protein
MNEETSVVLPELTGKTSEQKVLGSNLVLKVEPIESREDLLELNSFLERLPVAIQGEYFKYINEQREVLSAFSEKIKKAKETGDLTDDDLLTLELINLNNEALTRCEKNSYVNESLKSGEWRSNKNKLQLSKPKISKETSGIRLTGSQAVGYMKSSVGLSSSFWMPLYNSGFWINLEAPTEYEIISLTQSMSQEKTRLGTETAGGSFSNTSCFLRRHIEELLGKKIITSSLKTSGPDSRALRGHEVIRQVLITDYPDILTRFMALRFSKGYSYIHSCSNYTKPCNNSNVLTLNLQSLSVHDYSRLTTEQENFLSSNREPACCVLESDNKVEGKISSVKEYRDAFAFNSENTIRLSDRLDLVLKVPTIHDTVVEGDVLMQEIKKDIDKLIRDNENATEEEIDKAIESLISVSGVRQFSQWIDRALIYSLMETEEGETIRDQTLQPNYVDDREDIYKFLADLTKEEDLIVTFLEGYQKFIAKSNMTIVGYPQFQCPVCNAYQGSYEEVDKKNFTRSIIPFEAEESFFTLLLVR